MATEPPAPSVAVVRIHQDADVSRCDSMNNALPESSVIGPPPPSTPATLIESQMCGGVKIMCSPIDDKYAHRFPVDPNAIDISHQPTPLPPSLPSSSDTSSSSRPSPLPPNHPQPPSPPPPIRPCCKTTTTKDQHHAKNTANSNAHTLSCSASIICRICHNTDRVDR